MERVLPLDAAPSTRGPTDEERAIYASHRHLQTAGAAARLLALETRATSLAVKFERDALQAAVAESCGTYSSFILFWAATIMDANARAGRTKPWGGDMDLRRDARPAMVVSAVGKILIPLTVLVESPFTMPSVACPAAYAGEAFRWSLQAVSYRVGVFAVCVVALWTNYQKIQADEAAMTFLQEFSCDDFCASADKPDDAAVEGNAVEVAERGRKKKDGAGDLLQSSPRLISFRLSSVFYSQNTIADIVLNSIALQFILQIDVTVVSLVKHKASIQKGFASWFEEFDWYDGRVTAYLERRLDEKAAFNTDDRRRASVWADVLHVTRPRVFPFLCFSRTPRCVSLNREWIDSHWLVKVITLTDATLFPAMVYFLFCVAVCVHPTYDD
ncbi:hypothetical protein M885DRAFT_579034 [Pelagophyceae sp. CCMP2097]|nr:hypothetical protein M885DRAFT_579034 [Pelagophyceae sp. CCMP2097]